MASNETFPALALSFIVLIWGSTFVLVKNALSHVDAFTLVSARFTIAFFILLIALLLKREKIDSGTARDGAIIGFFMFVGFATQTLGLNYTTQTNSAFITGLTVVLIPLLLVVLGKKLVRRDWFAALIAFGGLVLLTYKPGSELNLGDLLTLACAFAFAFSIIFTGEFIKRRNLFSLATVMFGTVAVLSGVLAILSGPKLDSEAIPSILFLAFFATFLAFLVQAWAQKKVSPVKAGIIFSLEPVFAGLFSYFFAGEAFSILQIAGSALILAGVIIASTKK
ncbi:MAG: DMT family transporter [Candidatus Micrarchaeota archaeon]